jgi:hypothetical protein
MINKRYREKIVLHSWEICLLPLATLSSATRWRHIRRMRMCYQNLSLFWRFFLFCGETMSSGVFCSYCSIGRHYLPACYNSLNKQEACLINVWWDVNVVNLFLQHAETITRKVREKACNVSHVRLGYQPELHWKSVVITCRRFRAKCSWVSLCRKLE